MAIEHAKNYMHHQEKINEVISYINTQEGGGGGGVGTYIGLENATYFEGMGGLQLDGGTLGSPVMIDTRSNGFEGMDDLEIPETGLYILHYTAEIMGTPTTAQVVTHKRFDLYKNNETLDQQLIQSSGALYRTFTRPYLFTKGDILMARFEISKPTNQSENILGVVCRFEAGIYRLA